MAGTTPIYGFPYPTSTDLVKNGAAAIESLAESVEGLIAASPGVGGLFHIAGADSTSTTQTTTSSSYVTKSDCRVTFTTGETGVFLVNFTAVCGGSASGTIARATLDLDGAVTSGPGANPNVTSEGTNRTGAGWSKVYAGTPNTSCTVTLAMSSSTGTASVFDANIQVINLG